MNNKKRSVDDIVEYIKDLISLSVGNRYVFDKDVANELNITPGNLSRCKQKDTIPINEIKIFCLKRNLNIDEILLTK